MIDGWTVAWALWLVMFFVIEVPALMNKEEGDTLSEHLRKWFAVSGKKEGEDEKPRWWRARRFALIAFLAWFSVHLLAPGYV